MKILLSLIFMACTLLYAQPNYSSEALWKQELRAHPQKIRLITLLREARNLPDSENRIVAYYEILKITHEGGEPQLWAKIQYTLAAAYIDRIKGVREENIEEAIKHYELALKVQTERDFPPNDWATTQNNLAVAYIDRIKGVREENIEKAIKHCNQALKVLTEREFPSDFVSISITLSNAFLMSKAYARAIKTLKNALSVNDQLFEKVAFMPSQKRKHIQISAHISDLLAFSYLKEDQFFEAFLTMERGRLRNWQEQKGFELALIRVGESDRKSLKHRQKGIEQLTFYLSEQTMAPERFQELLKALKSKRAAFHKELEHLDLKPKRLAITLQKIRELLRTLPENSTVIAPLVTDYGSFWFVVPAGTTAITKKHIIMIEAFKTEDLNEAATTLIEAFDDIDKKDKNRRDRLFGQAIESLEPLSEALASKLHQLGIKEQSTLFYLPHSYLALLPLSACKQNDLPLLRRYSVAYLPNLTSIKIQKHTYNQRLLAVANPTLDLKYTDIEAALIMSMFKKPTPLLREDATKEDLITKLASSYGYFYFSGHGEYDSDNPLNTGVLLHQRQKLTVGEILSGIELKDTKLTVLSACQTGINDVNLASESIGLPNAFLQAGSRGVVSTLWSVNEISTMFLIHKFFELHIKEGLHPSHALAMAQAWLSGVTAAELQNLLAAWIPTLENKEYQARLARFKEMLTQKSPSYRPYSSPYYWAGFIYTGM